MDLTQRLMRVSPTPEAEGGLLDLGSSPLIGSPAGPRSASLSKEPKMAQGDPGGRVIPAELRFARARMYPTSCSGYDARTRSFSSVALGVTGECWSETAHAAFTAALPKICPSTGHGGAIVTRWEVM